jgi:hypothetical protein
MVLYVNEGLPDRGELAERATIIDATPTARPSGLASLQGELTASTPIGDPLFFEAGPYLQVERVVEMLAWHEVVSATETRHWGGWRERTEDVDYMLLWTTTPPDSSTFRDPSHTNPPLPLESSRTVAPGLAVVGQPLLETALLPTPGARRLLLSEVQLRDRGLTETHTGSMFYLGDADPANIEPGDVRVRFVVHDAGQTVTWFGAATRLGLTTYAKRGATMHELLGGDRASAIEQLRLEDKLRLVLLRLGGVLLLWGGLFLLTSFPIAILDIAPPVGLGARFVWGALTLPIAGLVGFGTIAVGILGNDWRAMAGILGALVVVIVVLFWAVPAINRPKPPPPAA